MYTDYIGSEPRCSAIAKKMIWWVAAICCTGGTMDANDAIVRARAMTAPSKTLIVQRAERKPILASELVTEQLDVSVAAPPMRDAGGVVSCRRGVAGCGAWSRCSRCSDLA
jgi:hypothetical protein